MERLNTPSLRVRSLNSAPLRPERGCVVYWMVAARRTRWSFGLDHALELSRELGRPLVVLEALRAGYRWASARLHRFVLDGMWDNQRAFEGSGVTYHPYVERRAGEGRGLLEALARDACAVVTDAYPCFFLPRMQAAAASRLDVPLIEVDSNGVLPLREPGREFTVAHAFRRHLQKRVLPYLLERPRSAPLAELAPVGPPYVLPAEVLARWPAACCELLSPGGEAALAELAIDHSVSPVGWRGGSAEGARRLGLFIQRRLSGYAESRDDVEEVTTSQLSPWLHFGHVSGHEVAWSVLEAEGWSPSQVAARPHGSREGWWGVSAGAEAFLDQIITWREVGFQCAHARPASYATWEGVPEWAQATLRDHAGDPRPYVYTLEELDAAQTHDAVWNAAQRQLRGEGIIHNYLRMLWGKKVLEWSATPEEALEALIELNNRYALDGRDPSSYSGILWCFGFLDRAWGPERPIFGKVRYMSSESTAKKLRLRGYLARWGR